jgi:hypothetical protein
MNGVYKLLNWMNDWHWGPMEFLRPSKQEKLSWRYALWSFAFTVGGTLIAALFALVALDVYFYNQQFHRYPNAGQLWRDAQRIINSPIWRGGGVAAGILFPFLLVPTMFAWNRRATELSLPQVPAEDTVQSLDIWPPPPSNHER